MADIPPDWRAIVFDETDHWFLCESAPFVASMIGVYIYDANSRVYLCEVTPSYQLIYLYSDVIFRDVLWGPFSDSLREEVRDALLYSVSGMEDMTHYRHVSDVDLVPAENKVAYGPVDDWSELKDRGEEQVREYFQGNCPF